MAEHCCITSRLPDRQSSYLRGMRVPLSVRSCILGLCLV